MARERLAAASRSLAALVGTLPPALLAGVVIAVHVPLARDLRFALGYGLTLPAWVAAMCLIFLVRRPLHAWLWCLLATALLLLLVSCGPSSAGVVVSRRAHQTGDACKSDLFVRPRQDVRIRGIMPAAGSVHVELRSGGAGGHRHARARDRHLGPNHHHPQDLRQYFFGPSVQEQGGRHGLRPSCGRKVHDRGPDRQRLLRLYLRAAAAAG
jgi:hypothetical protein